MGPTVANLGMLSQSHPADSIPSLNCRTCVTLVEKSSPGVLLPRWRGKRLIKFEPWQTRPKGSGNAISQERERECVFWRYGF